MNHRAAVRLALPALLLSLTVAGAAAEPRGIRAAALLLPDGQLRAPGLLVMDGGKIVQVGGEARAGLPVDEFPGGVIAPGLIDMRAELGAVGNLVEPADPTDARGRAADALNAYSTELAHALAAGVTAFALQPSDENLIGGRIAVVQTAGSGGRAALLQGDGPIKLSLSPRALLPDREPTSRAGAIAMLRRALEDARKARSTALGAKDVPHLFAAPAGTDVLTALELAQAAGVPAIVQHTVDARDVASLAADVAFVVGPLDLAAPRRALRAPGQLEAAGARVAIAGGLPYTGGGSLRLGAALAAREGLSLPAARRAITAVPAELLGVADRIGSLKTGLLADVVVFSADPLDLRAGVLAVYSNGQRVRVAPSAQLTEFSR